MEMHMKLGTLPKKTYQTKEYKSIVEGDVIDVQVQGKWQKVKIWKIYDKIPMIYFGEYI